MMVVHDHENNEDSAASAAAAAAELDNINVDLPSNGRGVNKNGDKNEHHNTSNKRRINNKLRILLGVTGSVAGVKGPELAYRLVTDLLNGATSDTEVEVRVLLTKGGKHFWNLSKQYNLKQFDRMEQLLQSNSNDESASADGDDDDCRRRRESESNMKNALLTIHDPDEEWSTWQQIGDPVLHIDLREWADVFVIAPLSAHTLAKLANGLCDDTLSCVVRAWDFGQYDGCDAGQQQQQQIARATRKCGKPLLVAPAMNTAMWLHPLTSQQLKILQSFGGSSNVNNLVRVIKPQTKLLACGEVGDGALASVGYIIQTAREAVKDYYELE